VLKNPAALGLSITLGSITGFLGALAVRPLCKKFGNKKTYIIATAVTAVLYILVAYIGGTSVPFLILRSAIMFMGSFTGVLLPAFANDIADYNGMQGQTIARAFIQSIAGTTIRLGSVISTMVASFGLAAIGYTKGAQPTAQVLSGITNLMAFGPAIVCIISCICFIWYNIDEKQLDAYRVQKSVEMKM
jgi:Na+/melibiose symporter-like transporter